MLVSIFLRVLQFEFDFVGFQDPFRVVVQFFMLCRRRPFLLNRVRNGLDRLRDGRDVERRRVHER